MPDLTALAVTVIATCWPSASVPSWQVIALPAVAHEPTGVLTPVVASCAGIWSVTTTSRAMPGPWFLTSSV